MPIMKQIMNHKVRFDLTNQKFCKLLVTSLFGKDNRKRSLWKCKCECGNETIVEGNSLKIGKTQSCGCIKSIKSKDYLDKIKKRIGNSIDLEGECWRWTKTICKSGYGQISYRSSREYAHRVSYIVHKGEIPDGLHVCHTCDNKWCVNPDHLWVGTQKDNAQDMVMKNRKITVFGEENGKSKLTKNDVLEIRKSYKKGIKGYPQIAKQFSISTSTVQAIIERRTWDHI